MSRWAEEENVFTRYLPYAIVFGCTEKWAKAFEGLQQMPPDTTWYRSSRPFIYADFGRTIDDFSVDDRRDDRLDARGLGLERVLRRRVLGRRRRRGRRRFVVRVPVAWGAMRIAFSEDAAGLPAPGLVDAGPGGPRRHVLPHARVPEAVLGGVRRDGPSISCWRSRRSDDGDAGRRRGVRAHRTTRCGSSGAPRSPTTWGRSRCPTRRRPSPKELWAALLRARRVDRRPTCGGSRRTPRGSGCSATPRRRTGLTVEETARPERRRAVPAARRDVGRLPRGAARQAPARDPAEGEQARGRDRDRSRS